ncbi:MAG: DUF5615 family PIN-like protein [Acidimicrobiia bacterium]
MRFVLDEDVDALALRSILIDAGHDCWTIVEAGLSGADDDAVAVYANDQHAALVSHDIEASARRRRFTFGQHVHLRCHQLQAPALLQSHLNDLVAQLAQHAIGVFEVRSGGVVFYPPQYNPD